MSSGRELWHMEILGNELSAWTLALATFLVTFTVLPLLKRVISARRRSLSGTGAPQVGRATELAALLAARTKPVFLWSVAAWLGSRYLTFPPRLEFWLTAAVVLLFWMQAALWAMAAVRYGIDQRSQRLSGPDTLLKGSMDVLLVGAGVVVWGMAALLAFGNLGVQLLPLLTGLGIGGIALALAVQTVLSDLLASLSIALDKPFGVGDFLTVDDCQGTVEYIGVKSTRMRSLTGEQIVLGNADLLRSRLRNFGRMIERRALFQLDVHYDTPVAALAAVPGAVREIIEATPDVRFDRCHLLRCAPTALQFEVVYFVTNPNFIVFATAQQSINLRILERFSTLGVIFAALGPTPVRLQRLTGAPATDNSGQQRLL
jgi:small-conductance mechanosensitive channel